MTRAACQCIQLLKNLTGMPVVIMVKVMAISDTTSPLTGTQFRKLHIVLQRALEAIAKHTTAEMVTTFQQENTTSQLYLFVVIITPDPDLDTKLTMKPFLRYLDTDDKLELNAGKLHFSATLTTKAMIWTAWPKPSEPGFFL